MVAEKVKGCKSVVALINPRGLYRTPYDKSNDTCANPSQPSFLARGLCGTRALIYGKIVLDKKKIKQFYEVNNLILDYVNSFYSCLLAFV